MASEIENFIKMVYKNYKNKGKQDNPACLDEEAIACFCEGRLPKSDSDKIREHILKCQRCAQVVSLYNLEIKSEKVPSPELLSKVKNLVSEKPSKNLLEMVLSISEKLLEIISTTGDIILGNEIIPLPVLRSRNIQELPQELTIIKEFQNLRINVKIEKKEKEKIKLNVFTFDRETLQPINGLRITLLKDEIELESYYATKGEVSFDKVGFGEYVIKVASLEQDLGMIKCLIQKG